MADTKFSQFPDGGSLRSNDIVVGLRSGENTEFSVNNLFINSNIIYVSKYGSPSGNGTWTNPFSLLSQALNYLEPLANSSNKYSIFIDTGQYSEPGAINLIPYISIFSYGETTSLILNSGITLSTNWNTGSTFDDLYIYNLSFILPFNVNFSSITNTTFINRLFFTNVSFFQGASFVGSPASSPTSNTRFYFENCKAILFPVDFDNCLAKTYACDFSSIIRAGLNTMTCQNVFKFISTSASTITISATSGSFSTQADIIACNLTSPINISGTTTTVTADASAWIPGDPVVASGTLTKADKSNAILTNATFTNFTPTDNSVRGALQGIDTKLGIISPSTYTNVFVYVSSTNGVDAVGRGGSSNPYATITYATAQITDNTSSKIYSLLCYGKFTEANLKLKSYVFLIGNGSLLTCTNPINLDATFAAGGIAYIEGFGGLSGNISLDFTSLTLSTVIIKNNIPSSGTWTITGPSSLFLAAQIINNVCLFGGFFSLTVTNTLGTIIENTLGASTFSQTNSSASNSIYTVLGNTHDGILTVSTTGTKGSTVTYSGISSSSLALSASSTGAPTFLGIGCYEFTAVSISGTPCVFKPDLLSVTPTFSGGAVDGTNILYRSLSASVTAGFSPTNYTAANTRVRSHLEGIDGQLANFNVGNKSLGTTTNDNAVALHVGEYISSSILIGSAVSLTSNTSANVTSISLTAGDWDVRGVVIFNPNVLTTSTVVKVGLNMTSATLPTLGAENNTQALGLSFAAGQGATLNVGPMRISISSTTTVYLVANSTFATSTMSAYGFIGARRVR